MAGPTSGGPPGHYLYPCMLFAHREEHLVTTVLGSCVAVCLVDPRMGAGGMNHYMLALWNGDGLATPKYGSVAIPGLVRRMLDMGCARERLVAKVFGGANVIGDGNGVFTVGYRNIEVATALLAEEGIPITARDVGGDFGRKLILNTRTGSVLVSRLKRADGGPVALPDGRPR
ncbi:chemotaxis protein CheD [Mesoterricola sediminis]|uniref:Probable chemoreceptor glutamine deamidase CheD n=1 Tax=Mesoterricola sediminis TaxID=2927980 RepID=A0AA48KBY2_9BACT|nr:chemotaxis protein CheD [Mesoterricola sediminis]BDU75545.1 putative chemoreceptor glutamine deamidase CheD [Mesoterricola sediminis]